MDLSPKLTPVDLWLALTPPFRRTPVRLEPLDHPALRRMPHRALSDLPPHHFAAQIEPDVDNRPSRTGGFIRLFRAAIRRYRERRSLARLASLPNHLRKDIGLAPMSEPDRHTLEMRCLGLR